MADLAYTGERAIPGLTPQCTMTEHLARYRAARSHAKDKRVLDACCGVGYGSAMLAEVAREVVGFDADPKAIDYAREHYSGDRIRFECCDVFDWQEGDFDLAVAFEALEHVYACFAFVGVLYRSLRTGGTVIVSTPVAELSRRSPYHVRYFEREELSSLMAEWFNGYICGQKGDHIAADLPEPDYLVYFGKAL